MKIIKLSDAIKELREKVGGYVSVKVEQVMYRDGTIKMRWQAYSDKLGKWSDEAPTFKKAMDNLLKGKKVEPSQDAEIEEDEPTA